MFLDRDVFNESPIIKTIDKCEAIGKLILNAAFCNNIILHSKISKKLTELCDEIISVAYSNGLDVVTYVSLEKNDDKK